MDDVIKSRRWVEPIEDVLNLLLIIELIYTIFKPSICLEVIGIFQTLFINNSVVDFFSLIA